MNRSLLHLSLIEGVGPASVKKLLEKVPFDQLYRLKSADIRYYTAMSEAQAQNIQRGLADNSLLEAELALIEKYEIEIVTLADALYPPLLKEIHLPPILLYMRGVPLSFKKTLAVVGSREADSYGKRAVNKIVRSLKGWTIVSGGAVGIDAMAHQVAIKNGARTVAIFGSGLLKPYPRFHSTLYETIIEFGGTLVSSFPLMMGPQKSSFPIRNRIIAGLSEGCLVVQAALASGALITAHHALNEGREVFAVPGPIDNLLSAGCHKLLAEGATLVTCADDINNAIL